MTFDWQNDINNPWFITDSESKHGSKSLAAPILAASQTSRLQIDLNTTSGHFQFFVKTELLPNGGKLRFLLNDTEITSFQGTNDWTIFAMPVSSGIKNFAWEFERGSNTNSEINRVWIDQVYFPEIIGGIPYPPVDLTAKVESSKITLSWQAPFETTVTNPPILLHYGIYLDDFIIDTTTETEYIIERSAGGTSNFHVIAVYENFSSKPSNVVQTTTPFGAPSNLRAISTEEGVMLSWDYDFKFAETYFAFFLIERVGGKNESIWEIDARSWLDLDVADHTQYSYKLRAAYYTTHVIYSEYSNEFSITHVSEEDEIESVFTTNLKGNYPNPFNPITTIDFSINKNSHVKLEVFNIKGALVKTLVNQELTKGNHKVIWNGDDNIGNNVASGIYFYKMQSADYQSVRKMVLLK